jgi:hypothetical protein
MPTPDAKSPAKTSALTSMLLVAEIIKARWYDSDNHQALHAVTVIASIAVLPLADSKKRMQFVEAYAPLALEHCADLLNEALARNYEPERAWADRDILGEFDVMWERRRLVADCAAVLLLGRRDLPPNVRGLAGALVTQVTHASMLWGQAQIPSVIIAFWARSTVEAGILKELDLAQTLSAALSVNGGADDRAALPQPYYGFTDVWALLNGLPHLTTTPIFDDTALGHLHFGRALMFLLAKRNLKRICRILWPSFTRVIHEEPELPQDAFFSSTLSKKGAMRQIQVRLGLWNVLVNEAIDAGSSPFLERYRSLAWLVAAYVSLVPYRAWTPVLLWLDEHFGATWYHRDYRPR